MDFNRALKNNLIRLNNDTSYLDFIDISVESHLIQFVKDGNELLDTILQDSGGSIIKLPFEPKDSITLSFMLDIETINDIIVELKKMGFIQFNQNFIKQYSINKDNYYEQILNDIFKLYSVFGIQITEITSDCIKYNNESNIDYVQPNEKENYQKIDTKNTKENQIHSVIKNKSSKSKNWIIGIVVVIFIILYNFGNSKSPTSLYNVNNTTYAATNKDNFDEMTRYINDRDEQALSSLMNNGQIITLSSGTEVYLVSTHFSYCIIRLSGSTDNLWIITEDLTKK